MLNMKRISFALFVFVLAASSASAQLRLPQPSQKATVMQTVGVTDLTVNYFRPTVKGRKIWGDWPVKVAGEATLDNQNTRPEGAPIVPYGHIWRTGANSATQFIVTDPVTINGMPLAAGSYSLQTIPGKVEWTVIFNKDDGQWGSFSYDAAKDALRVKTKPQWATENQEALLFSIDLASANSAIVTVAWEKARIPFTVAVDVPATTLAKAKIAVPAAKADDWSTPFRAAGFANTNNDKASAAAWIEQALKAVDASITAKETWQNLTGRANILLAAGRKDDAFAAADKAVAFGKASKADTAAFEKRYADLKAGKN
jgi:hypothetical protein